MMRVDLRLCLAAMTALAALLMIPPRPAAGSMSLEDALKAQDDAINSLTDLVKRGVRDFDKEYIASIKDSIDRLEMGKKVLRFRYRVRNSSRGVKGMSPPFIAEKVADGGSIGTTSHLAEPRSMIFAVAPPPGSAASPAQEQLRILNDARQTILPGGGREQSPPTVDFLNPEDLTNWVRIDLQQGLSDAFFEPQDMASTFDGTKLVVAARGSDPVFFPTNPVLPHLAVIDAVAGHLDKRIMLDASFWPVSLVISPDGNTAYVSTSVLSSSGQTGEQMVLLVDLQTGAVTGRIDLPSGGRSGEIVMTPDGSLLFVMGNLDSPFVYAIDVRSKTVIAQIGGLPGQSPSRRALREATEIAMDPFGTKVYVADAATPQSDNDFETVGIAVVDVATATVTDLIPLPGVKRRGSGDDLQVMADAIVHLDGVSGLLTFIDPLSHRVIDQSDVGDALFEAALSRTR